MRDDWAEDLLLVEKRLGQKTRDILESMIIDGCISEVMSFINTLKKMVETE